MSSKYIFGIVFFFFIGAISGTALTVFLNKSIGEKTGIETTVNKPVGEKTGIETTVNKSSVDYQAGFDDARKLVEDSSLGNFFKTQDDVRTVSGKVTAIDGNRITIHDESIDNPFDSPVVSDRTVIADINTKVIKLTEKTSAEIQAEMDAYIKAQKTPGTPVSMTTPYIETSVDVSSIHVDDLLTVTAGENIKTEKEFTVMEIRIQPTTFSK